MSHNGSKSLAKLVDCRWKSENGNNALSLEIVHINSSVAAIFLEVLNLCSSGYAFFMVVYVLEIAI